MLWCAEVGACLLWWLPGVRRDAGWCCGGVVLEECYEVLMPNSLDVAEAGGFWGDLGASRFRESRLLSEHGGWGWFWPVLDSDRLDAMKQVLN